MEQNNSHLEKILIEIRDLLHKQHTIEKIKAMSMLTIREVQELLPFTENQIRYYSAEGKIPCTRLGRHYIFSREKLEEWAKSGGMEELQKFKPRSSKRLYRKTKLGNGEEI